jgi:hypothetical protein
VEKSNEKIPYLSRLAYSLIEGFCFFLLAALLFVIDHHQDVTVLATIRFLVRDLVFSGGCGLLGSMIPLGAHRASFLYGLTMPLAVALIFLILTD